MHFYSLLTRVFSIVLCTSNLLSTGIVYGQLTGDYRSAQTGDWKVASNWEVYNGQDWVPASAAPDKESGVITIRKGHTITIQEDRYIDQTIVENGGVIVLDCEISSGVTNLLVVDGPGPDLLVNGTLINRDGRVINEDVPNNVTGTVEFTANSTYNHNKNGGYIPTALWDINSNCLVTGYANSQMAGFNQTFGNFTWDCQMQVESAYKITASSMAIAGNFNINRTGNGGFLEISQNELSIRGDLILSGGTFKVGVSSTTFPTFFTYNIYGDLKVLGGTLHIFGNNTGIINVAGSFSHQSGRITTTHYNGGNIVFNGTQPQIYSANTSANISDKINFTVSSGAILQMADDNTYVRGSGYFKLLPNATLGITSNAGISKVEASGNIRVTGVRTYDQRANYIYNGHNLQVSGNGLSASNKLTIDNAAGVTLSQQVNVNGILSLTNGQLTTTITKPTNLLILNDGATVSGGSDASFVNGAMKKVGDEKFTFPVGKSNRYMPITISAPTNATDAFTAEYFPEGAPGPGNIPFSELLKVSSCEYWKLDRSSGSSNVDVTLNWDMYNDCNGQSFFSDPLSIVVAHNNGNDWNSYGGSIVSSLSGGSVTCSELTEYGVISFGIAPSSPTLPVKFSGVKVLSKPKGIQVEFSNLTESDVDYYQIERSLDGQLFHAVKKLSPIKNDYGSASYAWLDENSFEGRVVYRIKAVETSGKSVYSNLVSITSWSDDNTIEVFVKGREVISRINNLPAGKYSFRILNITGQVVHAEDITHGGGPLNHSTLLNTAKAGIYIYDLHGPVHMQKKFLVR